jgi:hypothetical protein
MACSIAQHDTPAFHCSCCGLTCDAPAQEYPAARDKNTYIPMVSRTTVRPKTGVTTHTLRLSIEP